MTEQPARAQMLDFALAAFQDFPNDFITAQAHKLADDMQTEAIAPVMQIVTDYVIESNDIGGLDCNDLADRLRTAGYPLVGDDDHDAPDA